MTRSAFQKSIGLLAILSVGLAVSASAGQVASVPAAVKSVVAVPAKVSAPTPVKKADASAVKAQVEPYMLTDVTFHESTVVGVPVNLASYTAKGTNGKVLKCTQAVTNAKKVASVKDGTFQTTITLETSCH